MQMENETDHEREPDAQPCRCVRYPGVRETVIVLTQCCERRYFESAHPVYGAHPFPLAL